MRSFQAKQRLSGSPRQSKGLDSGPVVPIHWFPSSLPPSRLMHWVSQECNRVFEPPSPGAPLFGQWDAYVLGILKCFSHLAYDQDRSSRRPLPRFFAPTRNVAQERPSHLKVRQAVGRSPPFTLETFESLFSQFGCFLLMVVPVEFPGRSCIPFFHRSGLFVDVPSPACSDYPQAIFLSRLLKHPRCFGQPASLYPYCTFCVTPPNFSRKGSSAPQNAISSHPPDQGLLP